ncbi:hypothetical protein LC653_32540 [Nostoc sp. CHAB 5784]|uniref:hypothetical protein n=1 Tax=Nostoc mirabile TaxID=2907820 RepID=UPI001E4812FC|nr:hypothetical protein [Nostoc mirabile]MCC5668452.1 hypothetical protein [Nostoc mirabile CHAB5784]
MHIFRTISPGNKVLYEKLAKPKFEQEHQRPPQNRYEIRLVQLTIAALTFIVWVGWGCLTMIWGYLYFKTISYQSFPVAATK